MTYALGIDLGTTNSVIAYLVDGKPVPIAVEGSAIVPSVVLFGEDGVTVGRTARNLMLQHPERSVRSAKRHMGTPHTFNVGAQKVTAEQVSAQVLMALKRGAEAHLKTPVKDVVITVPAYFDDAQRRATLAAGELAGFNVLRLLNEPTAAALVYEQLGAARGDGETPETLLVYDLGGGTFDVSVLEVVGDIREVRAIAGNTHLGGDDFDELITRRFLDEIKMRHAVDLKDDPVAMARLTRLAEETKISLSSETQVTVRQEFLTTGAGKPVHLDLQLTRRELERLLEPLLQSTVELAQKAVKEAGLTKEGISRICLVGGSTRIPLVRAMLEAAFATPIHEEVDPDLAVGLGAAVQAGLILGVPVERILVDVAAHSLGISTLDDDNSYNLVFAAVLKRNTALPAVRSEEFYTMEHHQKKLQVEVFQGESIHLDENIRVGSFVFPLEPMPEHSPVKVEFSYDLNGVVRVAISQLGTHNQKTVSMSVASAAAAAVTPEHGPMSAVERKARRLLDTVNQDARRVLVALLDDYVSSTGEARAQAEDALLDFFLDHEAHEAGHDDDEEEEVHGEL